MNKSLEPVAIGLEKPFDRTEFRRCLSQFATGVTVVTARAGDKLVGMTANSFASVSLDPPLVLWSAMRASASFPVFEAATHFIVNILAHDQIHLSKHFGKSSPDKFDGLDWGPGIGGAPVLASALATIECKRLADYPGGDHRIFLGEVERFSYDDRNPLLFVQGRYGIAADHPGAEGTRVAPGTDLPPGPMNEFMTSLLYRAHGALSSALDEGRRAEGLTVLQSRLMAAIETLPGRTLQNLLPDLFLGVDTAEVTVGELHRMGIVSIGAGGELCLSAHGRARSEALLKRARAIEARNLADLSPSEISGCRRVLSHLIANGHSAQIHDHSLGTINI